ncbi:MAG: hypothetical protein ACKV22_02935 [Bryobacteraceae bacterium]
MLRRAGLLLAAWTLMAADPFEILYVNDGADFMIRGVTPSVESLHRVVDSYADAGHTMLIYGVRSGLLTFNYRSRLPGEYFGEGYSDEVLREHPGIRRMRDTLKTYFDRGIDPLGEIVKRAKVRGVRVVAQFRPNNFNPTTTMLDRIVNGRYYYEHPELRIPGDANWDYGRAQVRNYFLDVVKELLERYDIDGIDIDFTQQPPFFAESEPRKIEIMNGFVREIRRKLDRMEKARGKRMVLTAGVRLTPPHMHWKSAALDLSTWAKEGLIDLLGIYLFMEKGPVPGLGSAAQYLDFTRGTRCRLFIAHSHQPEFDRAYLGQQEITRGQAGELTQEYFAAVERMVRSAGAGGVMYRNYQIYPSDPRISHSSYDEYRSYRVDYRPVAVPERAPNRWISNGSGSAVVGESFLILDGGRIYHRDPAMLNVGAEEVTVEAEVRVDSATTYRDCFFEAANGTRHALVELFADRVRISDVGFGTYREARADLSVFQRVRLSLDRDGLARVYLASRPVLELQLRNRNPYWRVAFGHGSARARSEWKRVRYTLDAAFPGFE